MPDNAMNRTRESAGVSFLHVLCAPFIAGVSPPCGALPRVL